MSDRKAHLRETMKDPQLIIESTTESIYHNKDDWMLLADQTLLDEVEMDFKSEAKVISQLNLENRVIL